MRPPNPIRSRASRTCSRFRRWQIEPLESRELLAVAFSPGPLAAPDTLGADMATGLVSGTTDTAIAINPIDPAQIALAIQGADSGVGVDLNAPYIYRFGLTAAQLNEDFFNKDNPDSLASRGYVPDMIREYHNGSQVLFSTRWSQGIGARLSYFGMSLEEFNQHRAELEPQWQLFDIDAHTRPNGEVQFAAIWAPNPNGEYFELHVDQSAAELDALIDILEPQDLWPTRVAAYEETIQGVGQTRYISLWKPAGAQWFMYFGRTQAEYQTLINDHIDDFRAVHVDLTTNPAGNLRYSVIFHADPTANQRIQTNRDWYLHQRNFNNNLADGYVVENIVATDIPEGVAPANPRSRFGMISEFVGEPEVTVHSSLASRIRYHVNRAPARVGASILEINSGEQASAYAGATYSPASAIKAMVLAELARRVDADPATTLNTTINGVTLQTLAQQMISVSSNSATNALIGYLGMQAINDTMDALGMEVSQLNRLMLDTTAFVAGNDNILVPHEAVEFYRRMHENEGNFLSTSSLSFFWNTLALDGAPPNNTKGSFDDFLSSSAVPNWQNLIAVDANGTIMDNNKPGSLPSSWTTDFGPVTHKPQMGAYVVRTDAGRIGFTNGNTIAFAVFGDEGDNANDVDGAMASVGYEVAFEYADAPVTYTPEFAALSDGRVLTVRGTAANDSILIDTNSGSSDTIDVRINGQLITSIDTFAPGAGGGPATRQLDAIYVYGRAGGDTITIDDLPSQIDGIPVTVYGEDGEDIITVAVAATVHGGDDDDEIHVGNGDLEDLGGAVAVNGGGDIDTLSIDDGAYAPMTSYTVEDDSVARTGVDPIIYDGIEEVNLQGGGGANNFQISSTDVSTNVTGGILGDSFRVGTYSLFAIDGLLTIDGGENFVGEDEVRLDDILGSNVEYLIQNNMVFGNTFAGIALVGVEHAILDASPRDNFIYVENAPTDTRYTINSSFGDDTIHLASAAPDLRMFNAPVAVDGGFGENHLILHDESALFNLPYIVTADSVDRAFFGETNPFLNEVGVTFSSLTDVELLLDDGNNTVNVQSTDPDTKYVLRGDGGNDTLNLNRDLDSDIDAIINIDGTNIHSAAMNVEYHQFEQLEVNLGDESSAIQIHDLISAASFNLGLGSDVVRVTPESGNLSTIDYPIFVDGQEGAGEVELYDHNVSTDRNFSVRADSVDRLFFGPPYGLEPGLRYANLAFVRLFMGTGADVVEVESTAAGTQYFLDGGPSDDTYNFHTLPSAPVTLYGNTGSSDHAEILGTDGANEVSLSAGFGIADFNLPDVETATFDGLGGTDVLVFQGIEGADEEVEVLASQNANQGMLRVVNAIDILFEHTELIDLLANPNDAEISAFIGTDEADRFEFNLAADGTNEDPVLQFFEPNSVTPLLSLRDYRNFGTLNVWGVDGADEFNVFVAPTGPGTDLRDLLVDGGPPTGPGGGQKDRLTVYWEGPTPPGPSPVEPGTDSYFVDYDPMHRLTIDYLDIELAHAVNANAAG